MAVSPILAVPLVAPTQSDKTTTLNDMTLALEGAANDQLNVDLSGGNVTLTAVQYTRFNVFNCSGLTTARNLVVPMTIAGNPAKRVFAVRNNSGFSIVVGGTTGGTVTILAGNGAIIQNNGIDCVGYGSGGSGPPGIQGPPGGAVNISYVFDASTTNSDPGPGGLRFNALTQNTATAIYVDVLDQSGADWTVIIDSLDDSTSSPKGLVRVFERSVPTNWIVFSLSAIVSHTGYRELTVAMLGSSAASPFAAADEIALSFDRTGNLGSTGGAGTAGTPGSVWRDGTGVPAVGLGVNGDYYLDDATGDVYLKASGAYSIVANIMGPIGTVPAISNNQLVANTSGGSAAPIGTTLSAFLDAALSSTQGTVLYRSGSAWSALAPGTAGQVLQTGGAAANPSWTTLATPPTARNAARMQTQWVSGAAASNGTAYFVYDAPYGGTINSLTYFTGNGSFTVAVQINGTNVTGLSAISVSSATPATATATAANTFTAGQRITAVVTGATGSPTDAVLSLAATWS
jgi:hypothetical protein